jgi:PAS domain S-box-containing protein
MKELKGLTKDLQAFISTFDHSIKSIALLDFKTRFLYINEMYQSRSGYNKKELLGKKVSMLKSGIHDNLFYEKLWKTLDQNEIYQANFTNKNKEGSLYSDEQTIIPIGEKGKSQHYLIIGKDISQSISDELNQFIKEYKPCTFDAAH